MFANVPVIDLTLKLRSWLDFKRINIWKHTIKKVKNTDTNTALANIKTLNLLLEIKRVVIVNRQNIIPYLEVVYNDSLTEIE